MIASKNILFSLLIFFFISFFCAVEAVNQPEFSTGGFYSLAETGREVFSMNVAWKFYKGELKEAHLFTFDDSKWNVVSLPHGIELLPPEASGCVNYQGVVWYRKHFSPDAKLKGKRLFLHFEAIMGKCKIWVNGKLLTEHFGGYLPIIVDVTKEIEWEQDNIIAVCADNSDDNTFPPGKPQSSLDFNYFGGIYRDCWLIAHNEVYITDPNYENETAGGGFFISFDQVNEHQAVINLKSHIRNQSLKNFSGTLEYEIIAPNGKFKQKYNRKIKIASDKAGSFEDKIRVNNPQLWTPETPNRYDVLIRIKSSNKNTVDGFRQKIGIRSIEFKGQDGFWLNGKAYEKPLLGGNRHQDFAIVGNALSNNINWRDAYKLKKIGFNVLRLSHYPQDPSFMDACDELGIFVIVPTPGWQFWNDNPVFGQRMEQDIRQILRRDRNHPSVLCWEPILNETGLWDDLTYDDKVQGRAAEIVNEEYPYKYVYSAGGPENSFPVLYGGVPRADKVYFTREYGDGGNVNDWHGQNAPNRAARAWGEIPMLIQSQSYAASLQDRYQSFLSTRQQMGGAVWHSFDTQRGYHPDPFYGGIMDVFRQPKYAYYMYMSQRDPRSIELGSGPMVYIAHEMTPFSPADVTVYSNCDEVRLTVYEGGKQYIHKKNKNTSQIPSPIITFSDVYNYNDWKEISRNNKLDEIYMLVEGYMDGKKLASHKVSPSNRAEKIILKLDNEGTDLVADGSDFVTVVASVTDAKGNVKRLNNYHISFEIEGEARILGNIDSFTNPRPVVWGDAPVLLQSTTNAGNIQIRAYVTFEGVRMPIEAVLEFKSVPATIPLLYKKDDASLIDQGNQYQSKTFNKESKVNNKDLEKVYRQQEQFLQK